MKTILRKLWPLLTAIFLAIFIISFSSKQTIPLIKEVVVLHTDVEVTEVIGTIYNAVESQCDADPLVTADNSKINLKVLKTGSLRWVALSRDLLKRWGGPYNYGDTIHVYHTDNRIRGKWVVHDTMNARFKKRIDFLVDVKHNKLFPHKSHHVLISNAVFYTTR